MTSDRELFDRIAERYSSKDLHPSSRLARRHRLERTLAAAEVPESASVLEIGCGAGFAAEYLRGRYQRFVGIDYSSQLIELARYYNTSTGARFEVAHAGAYDSLERFDVVLMVGVLHHFDDIPGTLGKIWHLLRPGGVVLANEPHRGNPAVHLARAVRKRIDPTYSSDQRELTADELRSELLRARFEDVRVVPQGVFSTPFAEVALGPTQLTVPIARAACAIDRWLEARLGFGLARLSWNLVATGRRPES